MGRTFYIVDVFAESKYAGNQLGVITDTRDLATEEMQRIARELNFAETTFLTSAVERDGGYDVRIFTPRAEVPFAGHPTLGTAYVIRNHVVRQPVTKVTLNLEVGQIPVTFAEEADGGEVLWMRQRPPEFGGTVEPQTIAGVLNLTPDQLDTRYPVQEVSTGLPCIIVPLTGLQAVKAGRLDKERYERLINCREAKNILFFSRETYATENQINARMFAEHFGVPEDPATGSANGCLAGYLVQHRCFGEGRVEVRVEQGYEIARPSILRLSAERKGDTIEVDVGGKVVMSARGELV